MPTAQKYMVKLARLRIKKKGKFPSDRAIANELNKVETKYTERGVSMKFPKEE